MPKYAHSVFMIVFLLAGCRTLLRPQARSVVPRPLLLAIESGGNGLEGKELAQVAGRLPSMLWQAVERRGLRPTTGEAFFAASIYTRERYANPMIWLQIKRQRYRSRSYEDVTRVGVQVRSNDMVREVELLTDKLLGHPVFRSSVRAAGYSLPDAPTREESPRVMSFQVNRVGGLSDLGKQMKALPTHLIKALHAKGFRATTGYDYDFVFTLSVFGSAEGNMRGSVWARGSGTELVSYRMSLQHRTHLPSFAAEIVDELQASPILKDYATRLGLLLPGEATEEAVAKSTPKPKAPGLKKAAKMLVLPLQAIGETKASVSQVLSNVLLASLHQVEGLSTVGVADMGALLDVERHKDVLGCESSTCAAEIGAALGAEYVLYGQIGQIGSRYGVSVHVVDARTAAVKARSTRLVPRDEDVLADRMPGIVQEIAAQLN